jgi:4-aminobutyrate aminotransferase-like enzyme
MDDNNHSLANNSGSESSVFTAPGVASILGRGKSEAGELMRRRTQSIGASLLFYEDPVHVVRGEGCFLYDTTGGKFLDCYNNVASVGHCHPQVVEAISTQAGLLNTHTRYLHEEVIQYAERLTETLPGKLSVCMFVCSGTEANDLAMRIARVASGNHGAIVMENSYHGNSSLINGLSSCGYFLGAKPDYVATVEPPNIFRGSYRVLDEVSGPYYAAKIDTAIEQLDFAGHGVAAFMCDSIFDTQGTLEAPKDYFKEVYRRVQAAGGLCIADEVQAGFGRTGEAMWGFENYDVIPDIVTMGKPMGAGHPVAAVVMTPEIAEKFSRHAFYFNTFGGNPVSMAAANAVLSIIQNESLQRNAESVGGYLKVKLEELSKKHSLIGDVRGMGLFLGIELVSSKKDLVPASTEAKIVAEEMKKAGVLLGVTGMFGNVVKIRPPLIFSRDNADELLEKLDAVLEKLS